MTPITYRHGDATRPQADGPAIVAHICNDGGGWGAGFVLAISKRWPDPERDYRRWAAEGPAGGFELGSVRLVAVGPALWVANMIAQGPPRPDGPLVRYEALAACLGTVADEAARLGASVHMPRIGCGIAGGRWEEVGPIVERTLAGRDIPVTVYDFP